MWADVVRTRCGEESDVHHHDGADVCLASFTVVDVCDDELVNTIQLSVQEYAPLPFQREFLDCYLGPATIELSEGDYSAQFARLHNDPEELRAAVRGAIGRLDSGDAQVEPRVRDLRMWLLSALNEWTHVDLSGPYFTEAKEATFDHIYLNPFVQLNRRLPAKFTVLDTKEGKSMSSSRVHSETTKVDMIVRREVTGARRMELAFVENSLCSGSEATKRKHGREDRVKLMKAMRAARRMIQDGEEEVLNWSTFGLQLRSMDSQAVRLLGYQHSSNRKHNLLEFHTLFDVKMPRVIAGEDDVTAAINALVHMHAFAQLIFEHVGRQPEADEAAPGSRRISTLPFDKSGSGNSGPNGADDGGGGDDGASGGSPNGGIRKTRKDGLSTIPFNDTGLCPDLPVAGKYHRVHAPMSAAGAFARIVPAVDDSGAAVVLKIQSTERHVVELNALHRLRGVADVVGVLDCFTHGIDHAVLVLPRLNPVDYSAVARTAESVAEFAVHVVGIIGALHALDVAHGDIKPTSFMRDSSTGKVQLIDFNLAGRASQRIYGSNRLPGTPGWVLDGIPATRREHGDLVGLASTLGWLLGIYGFGVTGTGHSDALEASKLALRQSRDPTRSEVLRRVLKLLDLHPLSKVWPTLPIAGTGKVRWEQAGRQRSSWTLPCCVHSCYISSTHWLWSLPSVPRDWPSLRFPRQTSSRRPRTRSRVRRGPRREPGQGLMAIPRIL